MTALEREHGVRSVAFELLGPPKNSKLLFEAHLLRAAFRTMGAVRESTAEAVCERLNRLVLAFLLVFSWTLALVGFFAVQVVASGTVSALGLASLQGETLNWSLLYFAAAWTSGAFLFVVLGLYARKQRRLA